MKRLFVLAMTSLTLAACATNETPDFLAGTATDYAPSGGAMTDTSRYGYTLSGSNDWTAQLEFEDVRGQTRINFSYEDGSGGAQLGELLIAMPYLENGVRRYHGSLDDGRTVEVELQAGPCRSSTGDETFTHFAQLSVDATLVSGCGVEQASIDRWSNYLMTYLPAIDTCLAEIDGAGGHISIAYPLGEHATGVRLTDAAGSNWECVTRDEGTAVNSLRALSAAEVIFGEGDPIFLRNRIPASGEGCYVYEAVREADGSLIGALGFDACDAGSIEPVG